MNGKRESKGFSSMDVLAMAFGGIIGWGWVVLAGAWVGSAGVMGATAAFIVGGILFIFMGRIYAELTTMMPENGGSIRFAQAAFGEAGGRIISWAVMITYISIIAFESIAFANVMATLFGDILVFGPMYRFGHETVYLSQVLVSVSGTAAIIAINFSDGEMVPKFQNAVMTLVLIAGAVLFLANIPAGIHLDRILASGSGFSGFIGVLVMTPFMFTGFDVIPQSAGEMNIPGRRLGQLIVLSVMMATMWYLAVIFSVGNLAKDASVLSSGVPVAEAFASVFGGSAVARNLIILAGIGGILTAWNAFFTGGRRILEYMMSQQWIPVRSDSTKHHVERQTLLILGSVSLLAPLLGKSFLLRFVNAGSYAMIIVYGIVTASFVMLRLKKPQWKRSYRVKNWKTTALVAGALIVVTMVICLPGFPTALKREEWIILAVWSALALLVDAVAQRRMSSDVRNGSDCDTMGA